MEEGRKLGFWETGAVLLHDEAHGDGILFSSAKIKGKIDIAVLKEAFHAMFQRHPLLRATIERKTEGLFFKLNAQFEDIPLQFIRREKEDHWLKIGEKELSTLFPTDKYLWRATLVSFDETNELNVSFHHAIIDGFCCVHFVDQLLRLYVEIEMQTYAQKESLPLIDNIESLLTFHPPDHVIEEQANRIFEPGFTELNYQTMAPVGERIIKSHVAELPSQVLNNMTEGCHVHQVKMNSLLYAALLMAMHRANKAAALSTNVLTPLNLRNFCKLPLDNELIGVFVSYLGDRMSPIDSKTTLWELAKRYEESLDHQIPQAAFFPVEFTLDQISLLCPYFRVNEFAGRRGFTYACRVTNKGIFNFPEIYGPLKLESYFETSSCQSGQIQINLSTTSVFNRMFLCFSYAHPLVQEEYVKAVATQFLDLLKST